MAKTKKFTMDEVMAYFYTSNPVGTWRWGVEEEWILWDGEGNFWSTVIRSQPEHGIQDCNYWPVEGVQVERKEITTIAWVPVDVD